MEPRISLHGYDDSDGVMLLLLLLLLLMMLLSMKN